MIKIHRLYLFLAPNLYYNGDTHKSPFMALSNKVSEHISNATSELRSALFHSARNEKPATIQAIANLLSEMDKLTTVADILDHLDNLKSKGKNIWTDYDVE